MECDGCAVHERRSLQHGLDRLKDGLGIRTEDKVRPIAAIGRQGVSVVFADLGIGKDNLNLIAERINMLKVRRAVLKIDFHFLRILIPLFPVS